ncbi:SMODS domain-containing nucleotidyltransferase [Vibrio splendidus]|uniref:SMODS domain-containing nucleotidyltransferase n=1 Tax=Vibrio splendidus TaxID=29497 RepID=UPI0024699FD0|nr:nucleotidyltransferase [Vibrio splendidus]MDH6018376.1 nucleotidyltransferase [Vibrio splendidus]
MTVQSDFKSFLTNLQIKNAGQISKRYGSITRRLNMHFRDSENKTANTLQVGSYGRYTGIDGISDLDMLYIMPPSLWDTYKKDQAGLLDACKEQIKKVYPQTETKKDRNVIVVSFSDYVIEVVPVFKLINGKYYYPDTYNGGSWLVCDPKAELKEFKEKNEERNGNLRRLAKMVRAWKSRNNIEMSGFLIDTLCYRFIDKNEDFDNASYGKYDVLVRDFFEFLENEPDKQYYLAPGSNSHVKVKKKFQSDAKAAREDCDEAITARAEAKYDKCNRSYKSVFGRKFPNNTAVAKAETTEEFIEHKYEQDLKYNIVLDCEVKKDVVTRFLSRMLDSNERILPERKLKFTAMNIDIIGDFELKWKVLNQGDIAYKRSNIRGQIVNDDGTRTKTETADFYGDHVVECYALQNNVVVARDRIEVPIA